MTTTCKYRILKKYTDTCSLAILMRNVIQTNKFSTTFSMQYILQYILNSQNLKFNTMMAQA